MNRYIVNGKLVLSNFEIDGEEKYFGEDKNFEEIFLCVKNHEMKDRIVFPLEYMENLKKSDDLSQIIKGEDPLEKGVHALNISNPRWKDALITRKKEKYKMHLLGLGDVGSNLLIGLRLLGGDILSEIGIYDLDEKKKQRWEFELNQVYYPDETFPKVTMINDENLFDCDIFVFCASKFIPAVGEEKGDVRMIQYKENSKILSSIGKKARERGFKGIFAVVSDPVDHLCKSLYYSSNTEGENFDYKGLMPHQIRGYGLGVMNARANYFSEKMGLHEYKEEGRVFGPHGKELICANSISNYDDMMSRELTEATVTANLKLREIGYKPFVAPALSSGALSILKTLRGDWHYSAVRLGDCYFGIKNRYTEFGDYIETYEVEDELYNRINNTYRGLIDFE
ncbi:MAG: lactate dehydrogenase [Firmicutes bacterium]|jgi:malate/lactate dehydrogenase|nr:lactate dehydrogenase [Bacillota bacterium]